MNGPAAGSTPPSESIPNLLQAMCVELTELIDGDGCNLSRVIGELLVDLHEYTPDGHRLQLGRGYLLSDYPLTREVIELGEPRTVSVLDPTADASEVALLRELGFDSLLMLPFNLGGRCWGLVELYRAGPRTFDTADVTAAVAFVERTSALLDGLQRRPAAA
jgi:GAF domain-containing protein